MGGWGGGKEINFIEKNTSGRGVVETRDGRRRRIDAFVGLHHLDLAFARGENDLNANVAGGGFKVPALRKNKKNRDFGEYKY